MKNDDCTLKNNVVTPEIIVEESITITNDDSRNKEVSSEIRSAQERGKEFPNALEAFTDRDDFLKTKDRTSVERMVFDLEIKSIENFFTTDILNDTSIISFLSDLSKHWSTYFKLLKVYKKGKVRVRDSKFSEAIKLIEEKSKEFKEHICDIASCKQSTLMDSTMICTAFLKKSTAIRNVLVSGGKLKALITDKNAVNVLNKRINERNRNASLLFNRGKNHLHCLNNTKLTWDRVFDEIIDMKNSNTGSKVLSPDDLEKVAIICSSNLVTSLKEIDVPLDRSQNEEIMESMPILYLANKNNGVFINLHELIYMPSSLEYLLSPETNTNNINLSDTNNETFEILTSNNEGAKLAGGQPLLLSKFPELVDVTANFIIEDAMKLLILQM